MAPLVIGFRHGQLQQQLTVNSSHGCCNVIDLCIRLPYYTIVKLQQALSLWVCVFVCNNQHEHE